MYSKAKKSPFPGEGEGKLLQCCNFPFIGSRLDYVPLFVQELWKAIMDTGDSSADAPV